MKSIRLLSGKLFVWTCLMLLSAAPIQSASLSNGLVTLSFDEATGWPTSFTSGQHELLSGTPSPLWLLRLPDGSPY